MLYLYKIFVLLNISYINSLLIPNKNPLYFHNLDYNRKYFKPKISMLNIENENFKLLKNSQITELTSIWIKNMMNSNRHFETSKFASLLEFKWYLHNHKQKKYYNLIWIPKTNQKKEILYILSIKYQKKRKVYHVNRVIMNPTCKLHMKNSIDLFNDFEKLLKTNRIQGKIDYTNLLEIDPIYKLSFQLNQNKTY